jgi:hypothetical protein
MENVLTYRSETRSSVAEGSLVATCSPLKILNFPTNQADQQFQFLFVRNVSKQKGPSQCNKDGFHIELENT